MVLGEHPLAYQVDAQEGHRMRAVNRIQLLLLTLLTVFALHLMAHATGMYAALGWLS